MTMVHADEPGRWLLVGRPEGATRIWIMRMQLSRGMSIGLHRHGGDEIFRVMSGVVRFTVDGKKTEVGEGTIAVLPPNTEHGLIAVSDSLMETVGELEMGEWVTVIDPDGSRRQVEVRSSILPWHRPPVDGEGVDLRAMDAMMETTRHLL